jgi:DNA-binding transcriptional regulator YhcF (GntR family)
VSEGRRGTRVASKTPAVDRRARLHALTEAVAHFVDTMRHRGYTNEEIAAKLDDARRSYLL